MNAMNVLNIVLWSVQGFLALFFLAAGAPKLFGRGIEKWSGFSDLPRAQVVFIGFTEVLGAAGLVLPMLTGVLPWLTPLAAIGLAIIVLLRRPVRSATPRPLSGTGPVQSPRTGGVLMLRTAHCASTLRPRPATA